MSGSAVPSARKVVNAVALSLDCSGDSFCLTVATAEVETELALLHEEIVHLKKDKQEAEERADRIDRDLQSKYP